jgi:hypothetical protein
MNEAQVVLKVMMLLSLEEMQKKRERWIPNPRNSEIPKIQKSNL